MSAPAMDAERLRAGIPLLADVDMAAWGPQLLSAATTMLPLLGRSFPIGDDIRLIEKAIDNEAIDLARLGESLLANDETSLAQYAQAVGVSPTTLGFAAKIVLGPVVAGMAVALRDALAAMPWTQGYCPVCGSAPAVATLARREQTDLEHLVGGGGGKMLHCSLCGVQWRFRRDACPACGETDHHQREFFHEQGQPHERVEVCNKCRTYLLCVDLRELDFEPVPRALPLGLVHLDIVAQERNYRPMATLPWNMIR